jgi:hypothetical protein
MANSLMGENGPVKGHRRPRGAKSLLALAVAVAIALPLPLAAQEERNGSPEALAGEAVDKLMRALDLLIGSIPQFEAPYVNENGDIIIRRKHGDDDGGPLPTPEEKPAPPGGPDTTTT